MREVVRDWKGSVSEVVVARWPDGKYLSRVDLSAPHVGEDLIHFKYVDVSPPSFFTADARGHLELQRGARSLKSEDDLRRVRWAMEAAGLVSRTKYVLFQNSREPSILVAQKPGSPSDPMVEVVDRLMARHRERWKTSGRVDLDRVDRVLDQLMRDVAPVNAEVSVSSVDSRDEGPFLRLSIRIEGSPLKSITREYAEFPSRDDGFAALWRDLWDPYRSQLNIQAVEASSLDPWLTRRLEPGELTLTPEECEFYALLGEPLPYTWPDPEQFAQWAVEKWGG